MYKPFRQRTIVAMEKTGERSFRFKLKQPNNRFS